MFKAKFPRLTNLLVAIVVLVALVACGDSNNTSVSENLTASGTIAPFPRVSTTAAPTGTALSPPTPVSTVATVKPATTAAISVSNPLASDQTRCGRIPYYTAPRVDAGGVPVGPVYAAIGASDTVGTGSANPRTDSWVVQLDKMLPSSYQFVRLGIGGITLQETNQCLLPRALAAHPSLVTGWNVVNDIIRDVKLEDYRAQLASFLQQLTTQTNAKVFIGNVPNLNSLPLVVRVVGSRFNLDQLTTDWNNAIAQEAGKYPGRVFIVDLNSDLAVLKQHPEWISGDGLHPTTAGYARIAEAFYSQIQADKGI